MRQRVQKALETASRRPEVQSCEVYGVSSTRVPVSFENNKLKSIVTEQTASLAMRVVAGGRLGFSFTTKVDDPEALVENALRMALYGDEARFRFAKMPGAKATGGSATGEAAGFAEPAIFDPTVAGLSLEEMVDTGRGVVEALSAFHPDVLAGARVSRDEREVFVANSEGLEAGYRKTGHSVDVGADLTEGQNMLQVYDGAVSGRLLDQDTVSGLQERVLDSLRRGRTNLPLKTGKYRVVLSPWAVTDLLIPAQACLNGKAVEKGFSPWKGSAGEPLMADSITLEDDGTLDYGPGSSPFDAEGVARRRLPLIEKGVLRNFYMDLNTAAALGCQPTGNASRPSPSSPPQPGLSNLVMAPGGSSLRELLAEAEGGVFVDLLMGTFAGNPYGGVVTGNIMLGFKIENGQLAGRVKDAMIAMDTFSLLKDGVIGLTLERRWVEGMNGRALLPYVALDGVSISVKE